MCRRSFWIATSAATRIVSCSSRSRGCARPRRICSRGITGASHWCLDRRLFHQCGGRCAEGFRMAFAAHDLVVPEELVVCVDEARDSAFERVKRLLADPCRPTAIIAQGTNILNECLNAVNAAGLKIPTDISVVTIGDP